MAVLIQNELAKVNIEMSVNPLEFATLLERIDNREFDAVTLSWSIPYEPDPYQLWHSSQIKAPGNNYTGFSTPEMDEIIEKAREEFDPEVRNKMFHRFHAIVHENQPYTFLINPIAVGAVDRRFENVNVYALGDQGRPGVRIAEWFVPREKQKH
jgi:peptide/nickel transport system substrate-binding protein